MDIQNYLSKTNTSQAAFALTIGVSQGMVWQWISKKRPIPIERCVDIENATKGSISRRDLRPNDWQKIWPELTSRSW